MKLRNDLPDDCPPPNAKTIVEELRLYRLVAQFPPKGKDFEPHWEMYPHNRATWLAEDGGCDAKGLSLLNAWCEIDYVTTSASRQRPGRDGPVAG